MSTCNSIPALYRSSCVATGKSSMPSKQLLKTLYVKDVPNTAKSFPIGPMAKYPLAMISFAIFWSTLRPPMSTI